MITPTTNDLLTALRANPHSEMISVWTVDYKSWLILTTPNMVIYCDGNKWWWYHCDGYTNQPQYKPEPTQFSSLDPNDIHIEIDRVLNIAKQTHTKEQTTMTTGTNPNGTLVHRLLSTHPYPVVSDLRLEFDRTCHFTIDGAEWCFDDRWYVGDETIAHHLPTAEHVTAEMLHSEIGRVRAVMDSVVSLEQIKDDCVGPDLPTVEQNLVSTDRYRELEAELAKVTAERDDLSVRVKQKTDVIVAQAAQIQQHSDGWEQTEVQLEAMTTERDELQKRITSIKGELSDACAQLDDAGKSIDRLAGECDRLKSKADRAGLLSVVCRRLCGDENATPETVHKALDRVDDESKALDFIKERLGIDPDGPVVVSLGEVQSLVAQTVKSLGEKTVEVAKLQEGLTNYKAHVEGLTKRVKQLAFERDAERVGNKWLSETIEDLKRTTVKLPNEHTLRRLFNRHNTPEKYRDGTAIPTMERLLMLIESLESQVSVQTRRAEHMALVNCNHEAMISDTHAILDEHGVQSYAGDTYLGLPARLRQLFATHTKV